MVVQSEAVLEEELIKQLSKNGYERINLNNEEDVNNNFKIQLEKLNNIKLTDKEFKRILDWLDQGTVFNKAEKLRDRYPLSRENEPTQNLMFLNQKDWCKNIFQVSNQITMIGKYKNRYDVTLLINGLPLVQIELKKRGNGLKEAFNQIKRYMKHSYKGLFNYIQIFVISNGVNTKYFSNGNYSDMQYEYTFFHKSKENININRLNKFADSFLEPCHISKMISQYMVLHRSSKTLMVLRSYQKYAVEAILHQALEVKQNGYIWHTTGSGKTLTSFKVSQILAEKEDIYKVIFVVDRHDLDLQTYQEFNSFCPNCVDFTEHTGTLVTNLLSNKNKLVTTTIQKLDIAVKNKRISKKLEKIKDKNIIFIFDECHRSQFGQMHNRIISFFSKCLCYGFTGTPIFKDNAQGYKTTKNIFGKRLHTYNIKDAIDDENVLRFSIDFYHSGKLQDNEDKKVKKINTEEYLIHRKRLEPIVDNIISTYDKKTRYREFNAIFAVPQTSNKIKHLSDGFIHEYYKLFKEKEHDLKIAAIFTYKANENLDGNQKYSRDLLEEYITDYNKMFGTNYSSETYTEYHADVTKRMKNREIDLLLVINMFLTGFDSKKLNTLFIDKDVEYHTLLQAFSRTNRIYNERKSHGNIICYRPIEDNVDKALTLFSDNNPIDYVLMHSYEYYVNEFNDHLNDFYKLVKTVDEACNLKGDKNKADFINKFKNLAIIKNKMMTFVEFTFDDLNIEEQTYNDFNSVYFDIIDSIKSNDGGDGGESILNDIDPKLELFKTVTVNVDYIVQLLNDLDKNNDSFKHDKNRIIKLMKQTENLRSKIFLIEKFIDEELGNIENKDFTIKEAFDDFMKIERRNAICNIIEEENLDEMKAKDIFYEYEFTGRLDEDIIKESFIDKFKFIERKEKVRTVRDKILELFNIFDY